MEGFSSAEHMKQTLRALVLLLGLSPLAVADTVPACGGAEIAVLLTRLGQSGRDQLELIRASPGS